MSNLLLNQRDQEFLLFEQFGIEKLFQTETFKDFSKEDALMILKEAERLALNVILPTYAAGDKEACMLKDGKVTIPNCYHEPFKRFVEAGWLCPTEPPEVGGQGMPISIFQAAIEGCNAANVAFMLYPGLIHGAAELIQHYGTEAQKKKYMTKMYAAQWAGTMCITEPGAGSDVGAIKTTARRLSDGTFSITGTKCFISGGDHDLTENIIHPVLARIEGDPPGTRGISIFIVPKYRVNPDSPWVHSMTSIPGTLSTRWGSRDRPPARSISATRASASANSSARSARD